MLLREVLVDSDGFRIWGFLHFCKLGDGMCQRFGAFGGRRFQTDWARFLFPVVVLTFLLTRMFLLRSFGLHQYLVGLSIPVVSSYLLYILNTSSHASLIATVLVNGLACKDPKQVTADDFYFQGLHLAGNNSNSLGSKVTPVNVAQIPGLNTLGISVVRIDFAHEGVNPPHTHPRASEILTVLEGTLYVGFVTSNPENRLISKVLYKGDAFVFPMGLIHFQQNIGHGNAVAMAALSSQNPGAIVISNAVFGSNPSISSEVLTKAFQVDKGVVDYLQKVF